MNIFIHQFKSQQNIKAIWIKQKSLSKLNYERPKKHKNQNKNLPENLNKNKNKTEIEMVQNLKMYLIIYLIIYLSLSKSIENQWKSFKSTQIHLNSSQFI